MLKKFSIIFCLFILFSINSQAAGTDDGSSSKVKSNYDKAVLLIKSAKKYEKKNKTEKANKRYKKALSLLIKSNEKVTISEQDLIDSNECMNALSNLDLEEQSSQDS